jgi:hypothetical protein
LFQLYRPATLHYFTGDRQTRTLSFLNFGCQWRLPRPHLLTAITLNKTLCSVFKLHQPAVIHVKLLIAQYFYRLTVGNLLVIAITVEPLTLMLSACPILKVRNLRILKPLRISSLISVFSCLFEVG